MHTQNSSNEPLNKSGGGRKASPELRKSLEQCEDFKGLEEHINRYDLLTLVKRAGKAAGFTKSMIDLLDHYMAFTRDQDWEEGRRPIVYQAVTKTALDKGISERQIQKLEQALFKVGALTWNDSGNHRRYGQRCPEMGHIIYAYGVDLTPLAYMKEKLENILREKELRASAWMETKRQISWHRGQIRSILQEAGGGVGKTAALFTDEEQLVYIAKYEEIAGPLRAYMDLEHMRTILAEHKSFYEELMQRVTEHDLKNTPLNDSNDSSLSRKSSCTDDLKFSHYKYTKQKPFNKLNYSKASPISFPESVGQGLSNHSNQGALGLEQRERCSAPPETSNSEVEARLIATGLQHITLKQLLNVSSGRFKNQIPMKPRAMSVADIVQTAEKMAQNLHISQKSWGHACTTITPLGAAVCLILTDRATQRDENPVLKPGAYFNAMVNRAKAGQLKLHKSVMGILVSEKSEAET